MTTPDPLQTEADRCLAALRQAVKPFGRDGPIDRGAVGRLRELLRDPHSPVGLRELAGIAGPAGAHGPVHVTVAALYVLNPEAGSTANFGAAFRAYTHGLRWGRDDASRQFRQLLDRQTPAQACAALQPLARRVLDEGVLLDWKQLFLDLRRWGDAVKDAWRRSFESGAAP
jgi:hypothetical protein